MFSSSSARRRKCRSAFAGKSLKLFCLHFSLQAGDFSIENAKVEMIIGIKSVFSNNIFKKFDSRPLHE